MAVSVHSSGVFSDITIDEAGTGLHIPLASMAYNTSTLSANLATGDYRALKRAIDQSYWTFMTGTATGTSNPSNFNKPSYFTMSRGSPSVASSTTLTRTYSNKFTWELGDPTDLSFPSE